MSEAKPFKISKRLVWEAYQRVRANRGAAGVDGVSLAAFEKDLKGNLYKVWNRMSSGSYLPPPVRLVEIPKDNGGTRPLGIPTIADRVAQTVVKMVLEPLVEPCFHPDSYGYRPKRSALDAVAVARKRCWGVDWVIDLDIKAFFDSIPHDLVERAVAHHTELAWVRLYVSRWLRAPVERPDGILMERTKGTPQGGVVSPLLANLFLHYAFDMWMARTFPTIHFERFADDVIVHCRSEAEARTVLEAIRGRLAECGLELHSTKSEEPVGRVLCEFPAGDQHQVRPGGPENYSRVADGVHQKQPATGGLGSPHEPGGAGLDELLRAVLPLEVRSGAPSYQRGSRALGATEIQAVQTPGTSIDALAGKHRATGPQSVRPVAARRATGGWRVGAG